MKKKSLFMLAFVALGSVFAVAQESSTISEECLINISLFNESAKNKQYADAAGPWLKAYTECPSANKAIYSHGRNILVWQLSQTKDPKEIDVLRNRLMEMYDKRIQYFGDDSRYPTPWILGRKALDYITYFPEDQLKENAYQWLETAVDSLKTELQNGAVSFDLAARFYSQDPSTRTNGGQMADPNTGSSYFEIDQLKPEDYNAIKDLKEGEISAPFESRDNEGRSGNTVYKIIKVDKILPAHTASFTEDYTLLSEQAQNERAMEAIDEFIKKKIGETYIVIDPIFKDCPFDHEEWVSKIRPVE